MEVAMKEATFSRNHPVQVGFPDVENAIYLAAAAVSSAFAADEILYVSPTISDAWIATGEDPTAAADTNGNMFLPIGSIVTIGIEAGDKITATAAISVTPAK
jgi:hypothetical protein